MTYKTLLHTLDQQARVEVETRRVHYRYNWDYEPVVGASRAVLAATRKLADVLEKRGWTIQKEKDCGRKTSLGWCNPNTKVIFIRPNKHANSEFLTLVHEAVHAFEYETVGKNWPRGKEKKKGLMMEVVAESVAAIVGQEFSLACVKRSMGYIAHHNACRDRRMNPVYPLDVEKRIDAAADWLLDVLGLSQMRLSI
jgi:hypothetical protein